VTNKYYQGASVFNNFVNVQDIYKVLKKSGKIPIILSKIIFGQRKLVKSKWAHTEDLPTNWWDIPYVTRRRNQLVSGNAQVGYREYISKRYFGGNTEMHALSLGCGTGNKELEWVKLGKFSRIDAYDVSEERITFANSVAAYNGYDRKIYYKVGDVMDIEMNDNIYDIIFVDQSLHHFSPLEDILQRINRSLKWNGYLIVNEFVGPTRFQWSDRQLEVVNGLLTILPMKYKTLWESDDVKQSLHKPSILSMIMDDPSEAIESGKIMRLLHSIFNVVDLCAYGGNILHLLLSGIAHNFLSDDAETKKYLDIISMIEDQLIESGEMDSDFVVAVCKKK